jgi:pectate lyase
MKILGIEFSTLTLQWLAALTVIAAVGTAVVSPIYAASSTEQPTGWASEQGGTTGGAGGTVVTVDNIDSLMKYAKIKNTPYIIFLKGTVGSYGTHGLNDANVVEISSNKSILGLPGAQLNGHFDITHDSNVIVRNITIRMSGAVDVNGDDCITVQHNSVHIWLDHLDIADGQDGNTDIVDGSDLVTVSWTKFHYTALSYQHADTNGIGKGWHQFCNLLGNADSKSTDSGKINVTMHHVWWADSIFERMPRVRYGKVHVYNSLFTSKQANYCVRVAYKANLLVEGNAFVGTHNPIQYYSVDSVKYPPGVATMRNNLFLNSDGDTAGDGHGFTPPYPYSLEDASAIQAELSNPNTGAGATIACWDGKIGNCSAASVAPAEAAVKLFGGVRFSTNLKGSAIIYNGGSRDVSVRISDLSGRILLSTTRLAPGEVAAVPKTAGVLAVGIFANGVERAFLTPRVR